MSLPRGISLCLGCGTTYLTRSPHECQGKDLIIRVSSVLPGDLLLDGGILVPVLSVQRRPHTLHPCTAITVETRAAALIIPDTRLAAVRRNLSS